MRSASYWPGIPAAALAAMVALGARAAEIPVGYLGTLTCSMEREAGDDQSREIFSKLLKDEELHVDWLEAQLHQIKEMGYERYLTLQVEGAEIK